jgi:sugar phosphate isomerase/epimerase
MRSTSAASALQKTRFQIACMTLPYSQFPLARAMKGIQKAGFQYIAWGTTHRESDAEKSVPVMPLDGTEAMAKELGKRCRDYGLEPVMMFSMIYPEHPGAVEKLTQRLNQASAAGIPQVLTFGHTEGGNRSRWIEVLKKLGPIARDFNVTLVVKQHGGETGTGKACAEIVREVNDPGIKVNYDAGNVMDYLNVDPLPDIAECASEIRSMCMKDHRNWPKDEDCAPGLGEIDHYRLLNTIAFTGMAIPLCCENIAAPLLPRATTPEEIDAQALRTRIYLETVIAGLHAPQ